MGNANDVVFCPGTAGSVYPGGFDAGRTRLCGDRRAGDRAATPRCPTAVARGCWPRWHSGMTLCDGSIAQGQSTKWPPLRPRCLCQRCRIRTPLDGSTKYVIR